VFCMHGSAEGVHVILVTTSAHCNRSRNGTVVHLMSTHALRMHTKPTALAVLSLGKQEPVASHVPAPV
jgi:hypothetical protein